MEIKVLIIAVMFTLGVVGIVAFAAVQSEQLDYKHFETCVNAGGSYSQEGFGSRPSCEMP